MITALRKARKNFRGTGKPDLFITTDMHNTMILARDRNGRRIYETDTELQQHLALIRSMKLLSLKTRFVSTLLVKA